MHQYYRDVGFSGDEWQEKAKELCMPIGQKNEQMAK